MLLLAMIVVVIVGTVALAYIDAPNAMPLSPPRRGREWLGVSDTALMITAAVVLGSAAVSLLVALILAAVLGAKEEQ